MAKWSGSVSGTVAMSIDRVWEIAKFEQLHKWDTNAIENCHLEHGDGCSSSSLRCVAFINPDGSTGSLLERITYYDADDYTYYYEMDDNPLGYESYNCTFNLEDHGDETTTVNYSFEMDPMEDLTEQAVVRGIERVFSRRISLLEIVAADHSRW